MRVLAIDYGRARLGLALSDADGIVAHPLAVLRRRSEAQLLDEIRALVNERSVERIVVGLPRNMDGSLGAMADEVLGFAHRLEAEVGRPVDTFDERGSSLEADRVLREGNAPRKRRRDLQDSIAAVVILSGYLEERRTGTG
ncbi:MAG: Holliday junction resolvase RuvX [Candidatus Bipolaricaulota bacterium]|nr:MAG: Holliday junction resolvase RuvX [Candidatus Bipolaricaulota bacterium]